MALSWIQRKLKKFKIRLQPVAKITGTDFISKGEGTGKSQAVYQDLGQIGWSSRCYYPTCIGTQSRKCSKAWIYRICTDRENTNKCWDLVIELGGFHEL